MGAIEMQCGGCAAPELNDLCGNSLGRNGLLGNDLAHHRASPRKPMTINLMKPRDAATDHAPVHKHGSGQAHLRAGRQTHQRINI